MHIITEYDKTPILGKQVPGFIKWTVWCHSIWGSLNISLGPSSQKTVSGHHYIAMNRYWIKLNDDSLRNLSDSTNGSGFSENSKFYLRIFSVSKTTATCSLCMNFWFSTAQLKAVDTFKNKDLNDFFSSFSHRTL